MPGTVKAPEEIIRCEYSHDYLQDTHLTYTRTGQNVHLELTFQSEDPDMGTEEMVVNSDGGESFSELVSETRAEITDYLNRQDTSSFYEQQGDSPKDGIHDLDDYYGEFSRTSLYAFEGALMEEERKIGFVLTKTIDEPEKPSPMLPSAIEMKGSSGYRKNVFEGWKKLDEATITGEGYKVEFFRLSERTIDRMCDALNGWYNVWTKFRCEYTDSKGVLSITVSKPEDADKISRAMTDLQPVTFEHEGTTAVANVARTKIEALIGFVKATEHEKPSILADLKPCKQPTPKHEMKNKTEMER